MGKIKLTVIGLSYKPSLRFNQLDVGEGYKAICTENYFIKVSQETGFMLPECYICTPRQDLEVIRYKADITLEEQRNG